MRPSKAIPVECRSLYSYCITLTQGSLHERDRAAVVLKLVLWLLSLELCQLYLLTAKAALTRHLKAPLLTF